MDLSTYLTKAGITYREFGERVGVSGVQIGRIVNQHRGASWPLARRIERETGGKVKATSLLLAQERESAA